MPDLVLVHGNAVVSRGIPWHVRNLTQAELAKNVVLLTRPENLKLVPRSKLTMFKVSLIRSGWFVSNSECLQSSKKTRRALFLLKKEQFSLAANI